VRLWRKEVAAGRNPREIKVLLAREIVARFHGEAAAEHVHDEFEQRFRHGALPEDMPDLALQAPEGGLVVTQMLKRAGLAPSVTEATRLIEQGGVRLNGERLADKSRRLSRGETVVVQVGKRRFARVRVQ
jgi:tyrosyl-tRNA synthetase